MTDNPDGARARFWAKVDVRGPEECWPWLGSRWRSGYGAFYVPTKGMTTASRCAIWVTTGRWPGPLLVCHHCDNPQCVNPAHLFLGTDRDNQQDAARKGRKLRWVDRKGSDNPCSKLTDDDVHQIRALKGTTTQVEIARRFGVVPEVISSIYLGKSWTHLESAHEKK